MNKAGAAKWLRQVEIILAISGILILGGAVAATVHRWLYQAREERVLSRPAPRPVPLPAPRPVPRPAASGIPIPVVPAEVRDPLMLGAFEIPRLGVRAIVREGVDDETLAIAVGHIRGTAHAGEKGNTVLAAHRDTFFRELRNVRLNDRLRLVVPPNNYEYRVISMRIVPPTETQVLNPIGAEELTLVTCYPFTYIGHAPNRFIVRAARVE